MCAAAKGGMPQALMEQRRSPRHHIHPPRDEADTQHHAASRSLGDVAGRAVAAGRPQGSRDILVHQGAQGRESKLRRHLTDL